MGLIYTVYVSTAVKEMDEAGLLDILQVSRDNNAEKHITGMLLYRSGNFIQVLEGEETAVKPLMHRIATDPRHRNLIEVLNQAATERVFSDWSMGFQQLDGVDEAELPGFTPFFDNNFSIESLSARPHLLWELLLNFKKGNR